MSSKSEIAVDGVVPVDQAPLIERDWESVIHPFSRFDAWRTGGTIMFERGEGIRLWDESGRSYVDAFSGLMNVNIGHGRAEIAEVAAAQLRKLAYVPGYFAMGNRPAVNLAERLRNMTPSSIERFFFVAGGSEATDTAFKFARMHFSLGGRPEKAKFIAREGGFHGMTYGAVSATGSPRYHEHIGPLLPGISHIDPMSVHALEREIARLGPENVAAFIAEPVSVAAGVIMPTPGYWRDVQEILRRNEVLLILDEAITGFGRTGKMFGADTWDIVPDLMVLTKGLTSGYTSLGAVGASAPIVESLTTKLSMLPHGFTAGAHPANCAIASANLDIVEGEGLVENAAAVGEWIRAKLSASLPSAAIRGVGMITACDFAGTEVSAESVVEDLRNGGVLTRAYGDAVVLGPPLCMNLAEAAELVKAVAEVATARSASGSHR